MSKQFYVGQGVYRSDIGCWTRFAGWAETIDHALPESARPPRIGLVDLPDEQGVDRVSEEDLHLNEILPVPEY